MRTRWLALTLFVVLPFVNACGGGGNAKPDGGTGIDGNGGTKPQCSDGIDNDGDGKIDYPNDPGCFTPNEDSELDDCPSGSDCPQCANGIDDDGNGLIDYPADPGCSAASDPTEFTENAAACGGTMLAELMNGSADGTLSGSSTFSEPSTCSPGGVVPAIAYEIHLTAPKVLVATTENGDTSIDTVIDVRSAMCSDPSSEVACNDNTNAGDQTDVTSTVTVPLEAGSYFIIVEGFDPTVTGTFHLDVSLLAGEGTACTMDTDCGPGLFCNPVAGGTKVCAKPQCNDGSDNDGDGKTDYPNDPGCSTPTDNDETDDCPSGPNCPQCGNGIDDDGDGKIDYPADPSCTSAGGTSEFCNSVDPVLLLTSGTVDGDTTNSHDDFAVQCAFEPPGTGAPDDIYAMQVPALESLSVTVEGTDDNTFWDPSVEVLGATCGGSALACQDIAEEGLSLGAQPAGQLFIVVDGDEADEFGTYELTVSGTIKIGQRCDGELAMSGVLTCASGSTCAAGSGSGSGTLICAPTECADGIDNNGDGKIDYPFDPGCSSPSDPTEDTVCPGSDCPVCSNGSDDDADGKTDYPADFGCSSAGGSDEVFCSTETDPVVAITTATTSSTFKNMTEDETLDCGFSFDNDRAFALELPVPVETLTIDTDNSANTGISLELYDTQCDAGGFACVDTDDLDPTVMTLDDVFAGNYALVAQTDDSLDSPTFKLNVHGTVAKGVACTDALFSGSGAVLKCAAGLSCTAGKCN